MFSVRIANSCDSFHGPSAKDKNEHSKPTYVDPRINAWLWVEEEDDEEPPP